MYKGRLRAAFLFLFCPDEFWYGSNSDYEKTDHSHSCAVDPGFDAGVVLQRTGDDHDHNASNDCDYAGTSHYSNNADDACLISLSGGPAISWQQESYVQAWLRFVGQSFRALRLFFFRLTDHRRNGLQFLAVA